MKSIFGAAGDRLLSLFVPRVQASAACTPYSYWRSCGCYFNETQGFFATLLRYCYVSSSCHTTCDDICGNYVRGC